MHSNEQNQLADAVPHGQTVQDEGPALQTVFLCTPETK